MKYFCLIFFIAFVTLSGCEEEVPKVSPLINLKTGEFTSDGQHIPVGGKLSFGILASGGSAPITNLRIQRIVNGQTITELDKGMFIPEGGLDYVLNAVKSSAEVEIWKFMVMNANRDSAIISRTVLLGEGSAYGPIKHFSSLRIGMQNNTEFPNYLDLHTGNLFTNETVVGNESTIDLVGFVYLTSGVMSPTLCCPAYTGSSSVTTHYPAIGAWSIRNSTLYDYSASDNNLVNPNEFDVAQNDSLLVASFNPQSVSGLCKFCYEGKIIPFKTEDGKYGLIRVHHADIVPEGYMEIEVKVQE